jgi:hypothetical protein
MRWENLDATKHLAGSGVDKGFRRDLWHSDEVDETLAWRGRLCRRRVCLIVSSGLGFFCTLGTIIGVGMLLLCTFPLLRKGFDVGSGLGTGFGRHDDEKGVTSGVRGR